MVYTGVVIAVNNRQTTKASSLRVSSPWMGRLFTATGARGLEAFAFLDGFNMVKKVKPERGRLPPSGRAPRPFQSHSLPSGRGDTAMLVSAEPKKDRNAIQPRFCVERTCSDSISHGHKVETRPAMNECKTPVTWFRDWQKDSLNGGGLSTLG